MIKDVSASINPSAHYDRITEAWLLLLGQDLHYGVFESPDEPLPVATQRLSRMMANAAEFSAGMSFLDIGCGVGTSTRWAVDNFDLIGLGISTSTLGVGRANQERRVDGSSAKLIFEVRDGMDTGLPSDSFDRAWALESSHLMRNRSEFLAESFRVLRKSGRLVLCDIVLRQPVSFSVVRSLRAELNLLNRVFGDAKMETLATYSNLGQKVGFAIDAVVDISDDVRPTFSCWRKNAYLNRDEVTALIGEVGWKEFVDSCDVLESLWDRDMLGYGLLSFVKD
ncbi:SAM-dependent methyltransferase [Nocardia salmonicida]|uniref:SAM-dependent methyltransferase n=1 Tax=Nocardia salmonicida TaxID=53431 RepID=UPI000B02B8B9|nr:class I SAM-dependent methyltransferase [Nocardia salmonicida]